MFEYLSIKDNFSNNAHKISIMKYRQNIKTHPAAFSVEAQAIKENNINPKQLASLFDIFSRAGYQVNDIRAKNPAVKIIPKVPKKAGIAPIRPKIAIPPAMVIDCIDSNASPIFAYLYIKLNKNQIPPIRAFTAKGFKFIINVVAASGIAKDEANEPKNKTIGKTNLLFLNMVPVKPIIMAETKGIISSAEVKTVKKSLWSYIV